MEKNLTTGSVFKTVLYFSLPYLLSYFLQTLYGMADLFMIGRFYGAAATTAVSIGSQVMHMLTVMTAGLAMGATVKIGHAVGAGNSRQAAEAVGNTAVLFAVLSVLSMLVLLAAAGPAAAVMSTPGEAVSDTVTYLRICFLGLPFITAYNVISAVFRGLGDSKSPLYFIAAACGANIALDYLFIGAWKLGAAGAALATVLSQAASVVSALLLVSRRKTGPRLAKEDFRPRRQTMAGLLKIGVPVAAQDGFIQVSFIVITVIANRRGLNAAAAVGIVEKIISILFLVPSSMLSAVSALASQNIGAGRHDRARLVLKYAVWLSAAFGAAASLCIDAVSETAVGLFTRDPEVIVSGGQYLRSYVWDCVFAGIHFSFSGYFYACGMPGASFIHNAVSILCVRIPLAYLASKYFADTLFPMGTASPAGSAVSAVICAGIFAWMKKKHGSDW